MLILAWILAGLTILWVCCAARAEAEEGPL
jgi:hypothetical protein